VWWISRVIRQERELCCDDLVIAATGNAPVYARALASLEQRRVPNVTLAATGAPLMTRIHRILGLSVPRASVSPALAFLVLATAAALFAFQPEPKPTPLPEPTPSPAPAPQPAPQANQAKQLPRYAQPQPAADPYMKWLNEEVVWIITDNERAAFNRLQTDEERQQFIEQFWLRRDPTPDTIENEFREEYYRRIAWANDRFPYADVPGWKSDRGRVYIRYGPPDLLSISGATGAQWTYRFIEGAGHDVTINFQDSGNGDFHTTWTPPEPAAAVPNPQSNQFDPLQRFVNVRPKPTQ
jgi:GWxTD domain-containing protein